MHIANIIVLFNHLLLIFSMLYSIMDWGDNVKITEKALNIKEILNIYQGKFPVCTTSVTERTSDCFVYVVSDGAEYTFSDVTYGAKKGDVLFLARGSSYKVTVTQKNYVYIVVNFDFAAEDATLENTIFSCNTEDLFPEFSKLLKLYMLSGFSDLLEIKSLLYHIYSAISKDTAYNYTSVAQRQTFKNIQSTLMQNAFDSELNVTEIIKSTNISEVHFRRIFKQIYGVSPIAYVTNLRINQAKNLLATSKIPISKIAEECGYTSSYYFTRTFKRVTKMTPSEYRDSTNFLT